MQCRLWAIESLEELIPKICWYIGILVLTMTYFCGLLDNCKEEADCSSSVEVFIVIVPNSEIDKFYK